ncbi:MAG: Asp-tRNA(Asn)/Glu-tRNA(Gln) amidotransferase subunit GatB [Elusimicrobiota bacterium]
MRLAVGLEVHVHLGTASKLFCPCPADSFGREPNTCVCPVCTGQPGVLPVLNRRAVELAVRAALAVGAEPRRVSVFARKNYFYPDMPKNYQISQYEEPLAGRGSVRLPDGREIGVRRVHIEEDAGKLLHAIGSEELPCSLVDFNRAGIPLIEIVSEPELASPEEAFAYLGELKAVLQYCGVSRCDMEKGELRCDANVSVRPEGAEGLGAKVEVKNLNSFRAVKDALAYEHRRQTEVLARGGRVEPETRLFDADSGRTEPMRTKEEAHDYRYFPEPDLPPLVLDPAWVEAIRKGLPELPAPRRARFIREYGLSPYDAGVLTADRDLAGYFESVVAAAGRSSAKAAANWIGSELLSKLREERLPVEGSRVPAARLAELLDLLEDGTLSGKLGKEVFARMWESGASPAEIVAASGLRQVTDESEVGRWVDEAMAENPAAVADLRGGKGKAAGALVGAVMKKSAGKANPALVQRLIKERIR